MSFNLLVFYYNYSNSYLISFNGSVQNCHDELYSNSLLLI